MLRPPSFGRRSASVALVLWFAAGGTAGAASVTLSTIDQTQTQYRESDDNDSGSFSQMNATGTGSRDDCVADTCSLTVNAVTGTHSDTVTTPGTASVDIGISAQTFADSANLAFTGGQYVEGNVLLSFDITVSPDGPTDPWTLDATSLSFFGSLIAACDSGCDDASAGSQAEGFSASVDIDGNVFNFSSAALTAGDGNYPGTENYSDPQTGPALIAGSGSQVIGVSVSYNVSSYSAQDGSLFGINGDELTANGDFTGSFDVTFAAGLPTCGNGTIEPPEECDDNNLISGDGCSNVCITEFCGDGIIQPGIGEQCDDSNMSSGDGCSSTCQNEVLPVPSLSARGVALLVLTVTAIGAVSFARRSRRNVGRSGRNPMHHR
jgi:cysteine-rich repeat protein